MGLTSSKAKKSGTKKNVFAKIEDTYSTMEELQQGLRKAGLESSNLLIGIDYTKSNTWTGQISFNNQPLHKIVSDKQNPYQRVIDIIGRTLEPFDDDKLIPAFGFGDSTTTDRSVFPFFPDRVAFGVAEVLSRYNEITPHLQLSGPTSFAPLIRKAIEIAKETKQFHLLLIVADGQVTNERETSKAIVEASHHPISIIMVGVGDGPWDMMEEFDDGLSKERVFDNFQFVNFNEVMNRPRVENYDIAFAVAALQEVPEQYATIVRLGFVQ